MDDAGVIQNHLDYSGFGEVKSFCLWLVGPGRRMAENPLAHVDRIKATEGDGLERRALADADFADFIAAARSGKHFRLAGEDRAALYIAAAYTGFRASELASLTTESFDLDGDPPTATVEAAYSKRRRRDVQELRRDVAELLRPWLQRKRAGEQLWPGSWPGKAAVMVRRDLAAATAKRKAKDANATPIPFADAAGCVFDFHALRHQFISNLAAAGVHPKHAQVLARHSTITLTMDRYTHLQAHDYTAALDRLPAPHSLAADTELGPVSESAQLAATGTDEPKNGCATVAPKVTESPLSIGRSGSHSTPAKGGGNARKTRELIGGRVFSKASKREAPPGIEPGMADLQSAALLEETQGKKHVSQSPCQGVAKGKHFSTQPPPDLAGVAAAWDELPEATRKAILCLAAAAAGAREK